jgi:hypothetical protein
MSLVSKEADYSMLTFRVGIDLHTNMIVCLHIENKKSILNFGAAI